MDTEEILRREQPGKELLQKLTRVASDTQKQLKDYKATQENVRTIACKAYRTAAQTIANATGVAVQFAAVEYDTDTHWSSGDNTKITIKYTGIYRVTFGFYFDYNNTGGRYGIVNKNAALEILSAGSPAVSGDSIGYRTTGSNDSLLTAGDYIQLVLYQTSGGNVNTSTAGVNYPVYLSVRRVGKT